MKKNATYSLKNMVINLLPYNQKSQKSVIPNPHPLCRYMWLKEYVCTGYQISITLLWIAYLVEWPVLQFHCIISALDFLRPNTE